MTHNPDCKRCERSIIASESDRRSERQRNRKFDGKRDSVHSQYQMDEQKLKDMEELQKHKERVEQQEQERSEAFQQQMDRHIEYVIFRFQLEFHVEN